MNNPSAQARSATMKLARSASDARDNYYYAQDAAAAAKIVYETAIAVYDAAFKEEHKTN